MTLTISPPATAATPHGDVRVRPIRLILAGADSRLLATACGDCPHSPAGCCAGPPRLDWSDIGRIVSRGGLDWLASEVDAGRASPVRGGLAIRERRGIARPGGPRIAKCVYHGVHGCTIAAECRPATCNYFLCATAMDGARDAEDLLAAALVRALQPTLATQFEAWDVALDADVGSTWPDGAPFDRAFFAWLGERFERLERAAAHAVLAPRESEAGGNLDAHT